MSEGNRTPSRRLVSMFWCAGTTFLWAALLAFIAELVLQSFNATGVAFELLAYSILCSAATVVLLSYGLRGVVAALLHALLAFVSSTPLWLFKNYHH